MKIASFWKLLRPLQWIKNLLILLPAFFAQQLTDTQLLLPLALGFLAFCSLSSAVYVINDIIDKDRDSLHPVKKLRMIASGEISVASARWIISGLLIITLLISLYLNNTVFYALLASYLLLNILYSVKLKQIPIIDLCIIGIGFLIRIFAGGVLASIPITNWLVIMIFLGALMIGLGKRRDELIVQSDLNVNFRDSLNSYNKEFLNIAIIFVASITTVAYILYTVSSEVTDRIGSDYVYLTGFFVVVGMLRYLQLVFVAGKSGQPTKLFLKDPGLRIVIITWLLAFAVLLYFS